MPKANIYQIFYNQQTQESLDKGFIPLNNLQNSRPDWGEFWVIRNFLLNNDLKEDEWYGFLSPTFHEKTGLDSTQVHQFIKSISADTEIILLSPFWELIAFFPNTFSQGEFWHPGLTAVAQNFFNAIDEPKNIKNLIMHSGNTVYCNYFLAKPSFWRSWLSIGNQLFDEISSGIALGEIRNFKKKVCSTKLLIIDDFGLGGFNQTLAPSFLEIIDKQSQNGGLLITSQVPKKLWFEQFQDPTIYFAWK